MRIFGVALDNLSQKDILIQVERFLGGTKPLRIVTVNPEFLLRASRDKAFQYNLALADLRIVDGFGIVLMGWLRGIRIYRFPGADLMNELLTLANRKKLSVSLAVRKDGLSSYEEIRRALLRKYPHIKISGSEYNIRIRNQESGIMRRGFEDEDIQTPDFSEQIRQSSIDNFQSTIVLCNFGAPEQEYFLESLRGVIPSARILVGVGGAFDFLTSKQKRAPKWLRALGLEWLWRLCLQPKRFVRIWNATAIFLWKSLVKS